MPPFVDRPAVLFRLLRCNLKAHELLQDIEQAAFLQHHLPEIADDIVIIPRLLVPGTAREAFFAVPDK